MAYFPMFVNLEEKRILVVGGGMVAFRKVQKLMPYGGKITVVAPEILAEIVEIAKRTETAKVLEMAKVPEIAKASEMDRASKIDKVSEMAKTSEIAKVSEVAEKTEMPSVTLCERYFELTDLEPRPALVVAATDDKQMNHLISQLCHEKNIPVNVVDDPEACSFIFPALVQQGNFSAGICTGGASPTAAVYYKERLQGLLPENIDEILSWLEEKRQEMKRRIPGQAKRAGTFRGMFDACLAKGAPLTEKEMETYIDKSAAGSVALVGAGCGKADLITVRGLHLLQQCEAVVYDDLIDPELLDVAPESALRIYMGKRSGAHSAPQAVINQKLIELAKSGLKVVRLKGGDPYLFGRGGEEMLALKEAGVSCQEVPGIPSAIGIAAEAGIPVTHRGASRGLYIITAHTSDTEDGLPADFDYLAKLSGTLVFLMGLKQLPGIAERLTAAGKSENTPCAVLSGGNSANPAKVRAPLSQIVQAVKDAKVASPAIIMVGEVTTLDLNTDI